MFIDKARIHIQAGSGGRGCVSFRREKFVPRGGPDGGDGGKGGDIYLQATTRKNTLQDFRYRHHFRSKRGRHGEGSNRTGKSGEDLWIQVPVGTVVTDEVTGEILADLDEDKAASRIARGGRGGRGNARFATAVHQAPENAEDGEEGEERQIVLELKSIADAGLVGFPNAGKSTLLSRISAAKPRIASYPFTTLQPILGTVFYDDSTTIIVADIPGLIEGASEGHGLGLQFLRHIERTRALLHLVDVSRDQVTPALERYRSIRKELSEYGKGLAEKSEILVCTKLDAVDPEELKALEEYASRRGIPLVAISSLTGEGLERLLGLLKVEVSSDQMEIRDDD